MQNAYLVSWALCAVAAVVLAARQWQLEAWRWNPAIFALSCWFAVAYPLFLAVEIHDWRDYTRAWPYIEFADLAFMYAAAAELFKRRSSPILDPERLLFKVLQALLAASFLIGIAVFAIDAKFRGTTISAALNLSHIGAFVVFLFLLLMSAWFRIIKHPPSGNTAVHTRCLVGYLFAWSTSRLALNYVPHGAAYAAVCIAFVVTSTLIFSAWAIALRSDGFERPAPRPIPAGALTPEELIAGLRALTSEIR